MTPLIGRRPRSMRAVLTALLLVLAVPASSVSGGGGWTKPPVSFVESTGAVPGITFVPLVNSGDTPFNVLFSGIPDGIGAVPRKTNFPEWLPYLGHNADFVDLYVTHEESRVPFMGFADFQDSSVNRVRVRTTPPYDVVAMETVLPASAGFIRFCSAFMAGPREGFPFYTFFLNEESNDPLAVPAGAVYGSDPGVEAPWGPGTRQAGYSVWLNTVTERFDAIAGMGRHNHENTVVVPGGWFPKVVSLSTDDTFTTPSTPVNPHRPNLSQLYLYSGISFLSHTRDTGRLYAFRVTHTNTGAVTPGDPLNGANDFFEISTGQTWKGEFIPVPDDIADGTTAQLPQDALEDWSNANNVFQFIRLEDIDYDPDNPRVVYMADTGNTRLLEVNPTTGVPGDGRLYRAPSGTAGTSDTPGRIFKLVFNRHNPLKVDEFSVVIDAATIGMRAPDNLDAASNSLMLQEDAGNAKIWMWNYGPAPADWVHVATVDQDGNDATSDPGESSGILDISRWFGSGWWALDVQSHINLPGAVPGVTYTGPGPNNGVVHTQRREAGQLLLMHVPGS